MNTRLVPLAVACAVTVISFLGVPGDANARTGNSAFAGSKAVSSAVSTRPTPTPPRASGQPRLNIANDKLKLRCYHTRGQNQFGMFVHRTHCG